MTGTRTLKLPALEVTGLDWVRLLFEVTSRLVQFETIDQVVPEVLDLIGEAMPLRTVVLVADIGEGPVVRGWRAEDVTDASLETAEVNARASYQRYFDERGLAGTSRREPYSATRLQAAHGTGANAGGRRSRPITLPLVMSLRPVFGELQIEPAQAANENQLIFLNTVVNQLAVALDRFAGSRREIRIRDRAVALEREAQDLLRRCHQAHEEAHTALVVRDQFLAVVAHDLRDLVGAASMASHNLLSTPIGTEPDWRRRMEIFDRSVALMRGLLEDLVDTAGQETGHLSVVVEPSPVGPLVMQTIEMFRAVAEERSVQVETDLTSGLAHIAVDPRRFQQILGNLLKNAIGFSPAGGTIVIEAKPAAGAVRFAVRDHGPGVPEHHRELVFQRFWRSRPTGSKGSGLGLFIAKTLVDKHRGTIGLDSEPAAGSTFWFTIPLAPVTASAEGK